jgi:DNA primase large subunit
MRAVMEAKSVHDPEHLLEVALVAQLHAEGWSEDRIVQVFSRMEGFSEAKTMQQVKHALAKGYNPFKCKTIFELGGCISPVCPSYGRVKEASD